MFTESLNLQQNKATIMDKEKFLNAYIEIETKTFVKADKHKKLETFFKKNEGLRYCLANFTPFFHDRPDLHQGTAHPDP
jgi:hypothetical protein